MKLTHNFKEITDAHKTAIKKFAALMLELGCRKDNEHVGSGLGGNENQLLTLSSFNHTLSLDPNLEIEVTDKEIVWGEGFLNKDMKTIRGVLDEVFVSISQVAADKSVSPQIKTACDLCEKLAKELDAGDTSNIDSVEKTLSTYDPEIVLYAVRKFVSIERLVKYNVDESVEWKDKFNEINDLVNG